MQARILSETWRSGCNHICKGCLKGKHYCRIWWTNSTVTSQIIFSRFLFNFNLVEQVGYNILSLLPKFFIFFCSWVSKLMSLEKIHMLYNLACLERYESEFSYIRNKLRSPEKTYLFLFFSSCFKPFYSKIQNKTPTYVLSQYCFVILYNILICDYIYD
jgi:hypothetical protein